MNQQLGPMKQVMDIQKAAIESFFSGFLLLLDQTEEMVSGAFTFMPWMPEEGKNVIGSGSIPIGRPVSISRILLILVSATLKWDIGECK